MIATVGLTKEYGARVLFEDVSLQLNAGARYGLVGANGSGKSTFLRVVAGDETASSGSVIIAKRARVGVLRQDRFMEDDARILDLAMRGDAPVWQALEEQARIAQEGHPDPGRIADLEDLIAAHDGYTLEARASAVLEGLGIPLAIQMQPLATLSGGFKLRVLLAQVLVGGVDILLLDEPTNHLDILTIRWLERFLGGYPGCAVIISHDQRFLDNVTTHTLDVDYRTLTMYTGAYSRAMREKEAVHTRQEAAATRAEEEIARKRSFVDRFGAKATKASQAQSRLKQIEKIEVVEVAETTRRTPHLAIQPARPSGREVLTLEHIDKAYGEHQVLTGVSLKVHRGERVAVIGQNGLGKSTLLRIAVERLSADRGTVRWGHEVKIGYFPQDHRELLDDGESTPLTTVENACPGESPSYVRGHLGRVLFSGADVDKKIKLLSGGECARLIFALLAVDKPNVLVLDEPTNHLDMESIGALVEAVKAFTGTVIFVSHDRWFVSETATRILELTATGPRDFPGSYADYLARCGDDHLDSDAVVESAKKARKAAALSSPDRAGADGGPKAGGPKAGGAPGGGALGGAADGSWEDQKKRRNRLAQLPKLRDKVLQQIAEAEARQKVIVDGYAQEGFFIRTTPAELEAMEKEQATLGSRIEALMSEWEQLEEEIAAQESPDSRS